MMAVSVTPNCESPRLGTPVALFDLQVRDLEGEGAVHAGGTNSGVEYDIVPDDHRPQDTRDLQPIRHRLRGRSASGS